jgi:hypothetical protein
VSPNEKATENARNAYQIVTEDPVTLWDLQNMLTSRSFYANELFAPHWAVNLVGGDYAGLVLNTQKSEPEYVGNVDITQASMLAVVFGN